MMYPIRFKKAQPKDVRLLQFDGIRLIDSESDTVGGYITQFPVQYPGGILIQPQKRRQD
ncbi:hypothetical protein EMIT047CA2_80060 [Pseudomonas soli]